jgi:hypothetical protein
MKHETKKLQSSRLKPLFQAENETFGTKLSLELIAERSRKNGIPKQKIYTTDTMIKNKLAACK